jgi:signal transduction histidine kinase/CheY-like chemotaxis protein
LAVALSQADLDVHVCESADALAEALTAGAGVALVDEAALTQPSAQRLVETLALPEVGPDFPLTLITNPAPVGLHWIDLLEPLGNVIVLERPLRFPTLVSTLRSALRARRRQYEVQRLLCEQQQAVRGRDEFLALFAHALRTPLGTIRNASRILERVGSQASLAVQERQVIDRQADQMSRMLTAVLALARIASGRVTLRRQPLDLRDVARRALQIVEDDIRVARLQLAVTPAPEPIPVMGDPERLGQALTHLFENAIRHTPPGGRIAVSVSREAEQAVLRVNDTGIGLPPEVVAHLLSPSAELSVFQDRPEGGMKIGLALVRHLIELHGGVVSAHSEGTDRGCEFMVTLPLAVGALDTRDDSTVDTRQSAKQDPSAHCVLVVEDNPDGRETLQLLLQLWGYQVEVAEDGLQGVKKALALRPELALIDIGLPGLDGYQVARQLRAAVGPAIRLVAVTGYGGPQDRSRSREAGFDLHLVKPVDPDVLRELLVGADDSSPTPTAAAS